MEEERIIPDIILSILGVTDLMRDSNSIFSDEEGCNAPNN